MCEKNRRRRRSKKRHSKACMTDPKRHARRTMLCVENWAFGKDARGVYKSLECLEMLLSDSFLCKDRRSKDDDSKNIELEHMVC